MYKRRLERRAVLQKTQTHRLFPTQTPKPARFHHKCLALFLAFYSSVVVVIAASTQFGKRRLTSRRCSKLTGCNLDRLVASTLQESGDPDWHRAPQGSGDPEKHSVLEGHRMEYMADMYESVLLCDQCAEL